MEQGWVIEDILFVYYWNSRASKCILGEEIARFLMVGSSGGYMFRMPLAPVICRCVPTMV